MGKIKLIATDLDGTLLDSEKRLPEGFFDTVRELKRRGIVFVVASGRQYYNIVKLFEPVKEDLLFLADNGAVVFRNDECVFCEILDRQTVAESIDYVAGIPDSHILLCGVKSAYGEPSDGNFPREASLFYEKLDISSGAVARGFASDDILKVAVYDDNDAAVNVYPALRHRFEGRISVALSGLHWSDLMSTGIDKGAATKKIQQSLSISPDECMAFGDYGNDISLLEACTESYAMANATDALKASAKHIMPWTNEEGGVKRIIDSVVLC